MTGKTYRLIGADGHEVLSTEPGQLGGNRRGKVYGRLDCRSAVGALRTGYAKVRVFFADEATAIAAGYRPCGTCMRDEYQTWAERSRTQRVQLSERGAAPSAEPLQHQSIATRSNER